MFCMFLVGRNYKCSCVAFILKPVFSFNVICPSAYVSRATDFFTVSPII